jgi:C1A family cysteine protease
VLDYARVDNRVLEDLLEALTLGPVVGGFTVYESFESEPVARTGVVPMPGREEDPVGGHAVLVTGYVLSGRKFLVRNSWGPPSPVRW